jgi:hypothetical protein
MNARVVFLALITSGERLARLGDTHTSPLPSSFVTATCAHVQSLGALRRPVRLSHLEQDTQ